MGASPMPILAIVILVLVFEGLLFGEEIAEQALPTFNQPQSGGFWGALDALISVVQAVWGSVLFFLSLLTFNVPGAPWFVRVPIGALLGGGLIYSVVTIIRGN